MGTTLKSSCTAVETTLVLDLYQECSSNPTKPMSNVDTPGASCKLQLWGMTPCDLLYLSQSLYAYLWKEDKNDNNLCGIHFKTGWHLTHWKCHLQGSHIKNVTGSSRVGTTQASFNQNRTQLNRLRLEGVQGQVALHLSV